MVEFTQISNLGSVVEGDGAAGTVPPSDPIELEEHDSTEPFEISRKDAEFLDRVITSNSSAPIGVSYTSNGKVRIQTNSHVGVLTLPSGTQIEVTPKESVTRLLWTLQYAFDTPFDSLGSETEFTTASSFFDAIGVLFWNELRAVHDQGLHRDYVRTQGVEEYIRGRINVQQQLQRGDPSPTDFAVEYDEFTTDTVLNRAVLLAVRVLIRLVRDSELAGRLRHQEQRLRQFTTVTPVSVETVERIELSRLNEHYEMLLYLTKTILSREFFEDITAGENRSLAVFINMNDVFERIVERSFRAAATKLGGLTVEDQASVPNIIEGPHAVSMRPDVVVKRDDETPVAVIDAKWKGGSSSRDDVYQLTSYILALKTTGALVYAGHTKHEGQESIVDGTYPLRSVGLATNAAVDSYSNYVEALEDSAYAYLSEIDQ
jgi:5-methylcytosine-specific restriction enzyme subunit McrC